MPEPTDKGAGRHTDKGNPGGKQGKNYLLAIAIDRYQAFPKLYNCVRDAEALIEVLTGSFQFESENVIRLFDDKAREAEVLSVLKQLAVTLLPEDSLLIYYSGHGIFDDVLDEGYWLPQEAKPDNEATFISNDQILRFLRVIPARHIFLMADACFSGSLLASGKSAIAERLESLPSRWVLTSGRKEVVSDGQPGQNSPFAETVLEFLRREAQRPVLVSELVQYAKIQTAKATNNRQMPYGNAVFVKEDKGGEFVFHPRQPGPAATVEKTSYRINQSMLTILYGNIAEAPATVLVSSDDTRLSMTEGVSKALRLAGGETLAEEAKSHAPQTIGSVTRTSGGDLTGRYILHVVTVEYANTFVLGNRQTLPLQSVAPVTQLCLEMADQLGADSIAFPAIATGVASLPTEEVARYMVDTIGEYLLHDSSLEQIFIVLKPHHLVDNASGINTFYEKAVARAAVIHQLGETYRQLEALKAQLQNAGGTNPALDALIKSMQEHLRQVEASLIATPAIPQPAPMPPPPPPPAPAKPARSGPPKKDWDKWSMPETNKSMDDGTDWEQSSYPPKPPVPKEDWAKPAREKAKIATQMHSLLQESFTLSELRLDLTDQQLDITTAAAAAQESMAKTLGNLKQWEDAVKKG